MKQYVLKQYEPSTFDNLKGFLMSPIVQSLLIIIIIGGIYFELQTPGFGFPIIAAIVAAVAGVMLGAFSVVLETEASGISELPFRTFVLMMLPIHLAIGVVEGVATAAVVSFVARLCLQTWA